MPSRGYLLCCIERTGSNLLAETLLITGVAGRPWEYFNPVEQKRGQMLEILGESSLVDGFDRVLSAGMTPNGVFSAKVHWNHFRYLGLSVNREWDEFKRTAMYEAMQSRLPELLSEAATDDLLGPLFANLHAHSAAYEFVRSKLGDLQFIWLRRRNMVARAISLFRARQTNIWRKAATTVGTEVEPICVFNLAEIHIWNRIGCFQEKLWERFFAMHGISPHVVYYEDLVAEHEDNVREVLGFLGLNDDGLAIRMPQCVKQSGDESLRWEQEYRERCREAGV